MKWALLDKGMLTTGVLDDKGRSEGAGGVKPC